MMVPHQSNSVMTAMLSWCSAPLEVMLSSDPSGRVALYFLHRKTVIPWSYGGWWVVMVIRMEDEG